MLPLPLEVLARVLRANNARADDEHGAENLADLDSEELDSMGKSVRLTNGACLLGVPLAVMPDAGSWFVVRRERLQTCRNLSTHSSPTVTSRVPHVIMNAPHRLVDNTFFAFHFTTASLESCAAFNAANRQSS